MSLALFFFRFFPHTQAYIFTCLTIVFCVSFSYNFYRFLSGYLICLLRFIKFFSQSVALFSCLLYFFQSLFSDSSFFCLLHFHTSSFCNHVLFIFCFLVCSLIAYIIFVLVLYYSNLFTVGMGIWIYLCN